MIKEKILIVDDDRTTTKIIELQLVKMGYTDVSVARSASEALKKARSSCPDLLLMDINLGKGKDGIQIAREIAEKYQTPVIYVTAHADEDTLNRAKETHPLGYINKPLREKDIRVTLTLALDVIQARRISTPGKHDELNNLPDIQIISDADGNIKSLDSTLQQSLKTQGFKSIQALLPKAYKKHVKACLNSQKSQRVTGKLDDRIFSWKYLPETNNSTVRISITDITKGSASTDVNIQHAVLLEALDHLATGVTLINENLNIFYTNKSADKLLKTGKGLQRKNGFLNCQDPEITAKLHRMVLNNEAQALTVDRGDNVKPLQILITPLSAYKENYGHNLPTAIMFAFESVENTKRIEDVIRSLYNLSPSEARIAAGLVLTPNLEHVAFTFGITINTARTHLKRIYSKTNTNRLSTLVHMIVTGPVGLILQSHS